MDRRNKITLENLLQLKRAERPSPEFWDNFDRELRAKQLAALVQTKPWWQTLTTKKVLVRVCMPLGAAAAVAMSFGSFHGMTSRRAEAHMAKIESAPVAAQPIISSTASAPAPALASVSAPAQFQVDAPRVTQTIVARGNGDAQDAAGQVLAVGEATVKAAGQALAQLTGVGVDSAPVAIAARPRISDPLTQVATPRDSRRSRLLASTATYDPHAATSAESARSRDHIARRISDDSVYDSISRLDVSGNAVSIKF